MINLLPISLFNECLCLNNARGKLNWKNVSKPGFFISFKTRKKINKLLFLRNY